jgi:hypothetical protein
MKPEHRSRKALLIRVLEERPRIPDRWLRRTKDTAGTQRSAISAKMRRENIPVNWLYKRRNGSRKSIGNKKAPKNGVLSGE